MKGTILAILLVLGTCLIIPKCGADNNTKTNEKEPIWGKTYTDSPSDFCETYYCFLVHTNDNITINTTVTNGNFQVWFGEIRTVAGSVPLPRFFFSSSSDDNLASNGLIEKTTNFWIVSGLDQMMGIVIRTYSGTSILYTINKINATDPIVGLQNQVDNLSMNLTNVTSELNTTKAQLNLLSNQLSQLTINESSDIARLQTLIESLNASLSQNISDLWTAMAENNTILMDQLEFNITELTNQLSFLNDTLNERIFNIPKYNDTSMWKAIENIANFTSGIMDWLNNTPRINQTIVNQTIVNKTEVQPVTYINKTTQQKSTPDYLTSSFMGIIGGIIGGFIIATLLIRRKKEPEIIYMKNVEPPEGLKDQMMSVRKLQAQDAEAEVTAEENLKEKLLLKKK